MDSRSGKGRSFMGTLMSTLRGSLVASNPLDNNPILDYYDVGKKVTSCGSDLIWDIYDATCKADGTDCSIFVVDKNDHNNHFKSKRKAAVSQLRRGVEMLADMPHATMLKVLHPCEEGLDSLAFASEPIIGSLHNILAWHSSLPVEGAPQPLQPYPFSLSPADWPTGPPPRPDHAVNYQFLDVELRFGLVQLIEALNYIHFEMHHVHRNMSPQNIIITKVGVWKIFGLELAVPYPKPVQEDIDCTEYVTAAQWSVKMPSALQPNLDYMAPEVLGTGKCSILSDMFSLGLLIFSIYNNSRPILRANNNPILYLKQIDNLDSQVTLMKPRMPASLHEALAKMLSRDPHTRPTTHLLPLIKESSELPIDALQFLESGKDKGNTARTAFYMKTLLHALPFIPKKLRWMYVWPHLRSEMQVSERLAAVMHSVMWVVAESTPEEYAHFILRPMGTLCRTMLRSSLGEPATAVLLEQVHQVARKIKQEDVDNELLPMIFYSLKSSNKDVQAAVLTAAESMSGYVTDKHLHDMIIPHVRIILQKNSSNTEVINRTLAVFEKVLPRLEVQRVLDTCIPTILDMKPADPAEILRIAKLYKKVNIEKDLQLNSQLMVLSMVHSLASFTFNERINAEQFRELMKILFYILKKHGKRQLHVIKQRRLPKENPEQKLMVRRPVTTEPVEFVIPKLRVDRSKSSSADNAAGAPRPPDDAPFTIGSAFAGLRSKLNTSCGQRVFGPNNSKSNDNNFLRVMTSVPMTPKIHVTPSSASSPGGAPAGAPAGAAGLSSRRHSSIGPQERRVSNANLSPQTVNPKTPVVASSSSLSVPSTSRHGNKREPNTNAPTNRSVTRQPVARSKSPLSGRPVKNKAALNTRPASPRGKASLSTDTVTQANGSAQQSAPSPFLLTSSAATARARRTSPGARVSGFLHQINRGVVRHLPGSAADAGRTLQDGLTAQWQALQQATSAGFNAVQNIMFR